MQSVIYDPLEEYEGKLREQHRANTTGFFEKLVTQSGVDVEQNRETVKQYHTYKENLKKLRKKLNLLRFLRVLMCITIILIPLVILKTTPKIKALRSEIQEADKKAEELLAEARRQMLPLNSLFTDRDALNIIEKTIPLLSFDNCFSVKQEEDMKQNYDFSGYDDDEQSTLEVLAGHYNENPFLFENKMIHSMGVETYHGYKTIYWTETYRDSNGKLQTRTRSQTLHATVVKPKPYYHTQVVLSYCTQGGPDLTFTRDATHLENKSDKEIERYVKKGEKKLKKKTDQAVRENGDFMSMSNSDFEVLFDALDRNNEVQFRTLFTPLAQTNMVSLIRSQVGYGDDFNFIKQKRTNRIITQHSQGRPVTLSRDKYTSYSYDIIRENFIGNNTGFFKAVYFDFAPLWAIPVYQERPVHSLKPIPDYSQKYSLKECEALANAVDYQYVVHPRTKTQAILKSAFVRSRDDMDETQITAYSYDIEPRIDFVPMLGGDGRLHSVPVPWDDYLPLVAQNHFYISTAEEAKNQTIIARRNGLCISKLK
ncbi:MAG: hypothetical protein E7439_05650 [Ruminococcaceae bacterium]|nr:hypothetical protein [Oscillospiraceae bacterium]